MVEFEVDMAYLEEYGELDCVILHDENGEMECMKFVPEKTCHNITAQEGGFLCDVCTFGDFGGLRGTKVNTVQIAVRK